MCVCRASASGIGKKVENIRDSSWHFYKYAWDLRQGQSVKKHKQLLYNNREQQQIKKLSSIGKFLTIFI